MAHGSSVLTLILEDMTGGIIVLDNMSQGTVCLCINSLGDWVLVYWSNIVDLGPWLLVDLYPFSMELRRKIFPSLKIIIAFVKFRD